MGEDPSLHDGVEQVVFTNAVCSITRRTSGRFQVRLRREVDPVRHAVGTFPTYDTAYAVARALRRFQRIQHDAMVAAADQRVGRVRPTT